MSLTEKQKRNEKYDQTTLNNFNMFFSSNVCLMAYFRQMLQIERCDWNHSNRIDCVRRWPLRKRWLVQVLSVYIPLCVLVLHVKSLSFFQLANQIKAQKNWAYRNNLQIFYLRKLQRVR